MLKAKYLASHLILYFVLVKSFYLCLLIKKASEATKELNDVEFCFCQLLIFTFNDFIQFAYIYLGWSMIYLFGHAMQHAGS